MGTCPSPGKSRSQSISGSPLWSPYSWRGILQLKRPTRRQLPESTGNEGVCNCLRAVPEPPRHPRGACGAEGWPEPGRSAPHVKGKLPCHLHTRPWPCQPRLCSPRGPALPARGHTQAAGAGQGTGAQGTHPRTPAGSTAGCTAASCSPASARRKRLRCLPKPRDREQLPARATPRGWGRGGER